jgi:hypothetical protein
MNKAEIIGAIAIPFVLIIIAGGVLAALVNYFSPGRDWRRKEAKERKRTTRRQTIETELLEQPWDSTTRTLVFEIVEYNWNYTSQQYRTTAKSVKTFSSLEDAKLFVNIERVTNDKQFLIREIFQETKKRIIT